MNTHKNDDGPPSRSPKCTVAATGPTACASTDIGRCGTPAWPQLAAEPACKDPAVWALQYQLRRFIDLAPVPILSLNDTAICSANQSSCALLGCRPGCSLMHLSIHSLLDQDTIDQIFSTMPGSPGEESTLLLPNVRVTRLDGQNTTVDIAVVRHAKLQAHMRHLILSDVTQREAERRELQQSRYELRCLSASIIDARESERSRIARELHDELGQQLSAMKLDLADLGHELHGRSSQHRLTTILDMLDNTMASVRRISADLRPLMLDDLGLHAALQWLVDDTAKRQGLSIELALDLDEPAYDHRAAIAIYRMVQEALTNVVRHARASKGTVRLSAGDDHLSLCVTDDGIGMPNAAIGKQNSFGLLGMRERALLLGGSLRVAHGPQQHGTVLHITLPMNRVISDGQS